MTAPSQYLRELREGAARRRLELAKLLRDDPKATNIELSKALGVNRDTVALDRKIIMTELTTKTANETEQLRAALVQRLENLNAELERHRNKGKLPVTVVKEMHAVTRSLIELLGVRKPVTEKLEVRKKTISFTTTIVGGKGNSEPKQFAVTTQQLALKEGTDETR